MQSVTAWYRELKRGRARSNVLTSCHLKDSFDATSGYPGNSCNDSNHKGNAERQYKKT